MKTTRDPTPDELLAGLVLIDQLLFRLFFFGDELKQEPSVSQKLMFLDESKRVLLCTGRKVAKTVNLEAAIFQFGLLHRQGPEGGVTEALMFTPRENHLIPFLDRVMGRMEKTPLLRGCIRTYRKGGESPTMEFHTGLRWYFRIEGMDGQDTNMVGIRAQYIVGDEMAFGNDKCHSSRLQTALPGCRWIYAGVPNGVRSSPFYRLDQTPEGKFWSKHKYPTFINPIYDTQESRDQLKADYKGETTQGYVTQVLGEWGDELVSSFPPGSIGFHTRPYYVKSILSRSAERDLGSIALLVGIPSIRVFQFAFGWDYGFSPDPSVIWGAYNEESDPERWYLYCRVVMQRVALPHQIDIVHHLAWTVFQGNFIGLSCDNLSAVQLLQKTRREGEVFELYKWANPGGSTKVKLSHEEQIEFFPRPEDRKEEASIPNKELYTTWFKSWLTAYSLELAGRKLAIAHDVEVEEELGGTTEKKTVGGRTLYYAPADPENKGRVLDHNRDAGTYLCDAIQTGVAATMVDESEDDLIDSMGWAGEREDWSVPWSTSS